MPEKIIDPTERSAEATDKGEAVVYLMKLRILITRLPDRDRRDILPHIHELLACTSRAA